MSDRVADALRWGEEQLDSAGIAAARLEATLLLGHALGRSRAQLLAALSETLTDVQVREFHRLIERRSDHQPLQYLRGRAPFLDFEIEVRPGVFIPRPETEQVVEAALERWNPRQGPWGIDVGTGSGAIAVGLARGCPGGRVCAIDRSTAALAATAGNAARLGVTKRVGLVRGDLLSPIAASREATSGECRPEIGLVVSNPPYAALDDEVTAEVRDHEPREAWSAGPTGMEIYERLVPQAAALLLPGRSMVLELGFGQEDAARALLERDGRWETPQVDVDYRGIPRVLSVARAAS